MKRADFLKRVTFFGAFLLLFAYTMEATETKKLVLIETPYGNIKVRLYDETPQHRDNFIKLVESHFYDSLLFHRVIKDFMIQGGDPESKNATPNAQLGAGGPGYQIPAEIVYPDLFHKRGALSAARTGDQVNPMKASSGSQFYIVWGKTYTESELKGMEPQKVQQAMRTYFNDMAFQVKDSIQAMQASNNTAGLDALEKELIAKTEAAFMLNPDKGKFTAEQKAVYATTGGTPFLDGDYTVFGEVIEGLEVVDEIQRCPTGTADRPKTDITMTMRIITE